MVADGLSRLLDVREEQICLLDTFILSTDIFDEISKVHDEQVGHVGVKLCLQDYESNRNTGITLDIM